MCVWGGSQLTETQVPQKYNPNLKCTLPLPQSISSPIMHTCMLSLRELPFLGIVVGWTPGLAHVIL